MDALTLILCRKIADIDGWSGVDTITNVGALAAIVDGKGGVMGKALLLGLMFKYKVTIDYDDNLVGILRRVEGTDSHWDYLSDSSYESDDGRPRAILECIIQANEL
jgi:hypothetical protein